MRIEQLFECIEDRRAFTIDELPAVPGLSAQLGRWVDKGYLVRLRRGLYRLGFGPPPHPYLLSNLLRPDSYITGYSALDFHGILKQPYLGPIGAATKTRAVSMVIESQEFTFQKISHPVVEELSSDSKFRVATPEGVIFDLYRGRTWSPKFDRFEMHYELFDEDKFWQLARNSKVRGNQSRVVGRLVLRIRQAKKFLKLRAMGPQTPIQRFCARR